MLSVGPLMALHKGRRIPALVLVAVEDALVSRIPNHQMSG
jgi:hypothetical protein